MIIHQKKVTALVVLVALLGLFSCSSTKKSEEPVNEKTDYVFEAGGDSDSGTAADLKTVNFDFDSSVLRSDTMTTLDANIVYLQEHREVELQLEGHCDERGSAQYNLVLGDGRARAVRDYLVNNGIDGKRLSIISIGKERPIAFGHNQDSWMQNRRVNFVVSKIR